MWWFNLSFFIIPFFSLYWGKVMFGDAFQFNNAECIATPTCMQRKKNEVVVCSTL